MQPSLKIADTNARRITPVLCGSNCDSGDSSSRLVVNTSVTFTGLYNCQLNLHFNIRVNTTLRK